jgi:DNA polymerase III epsilon subunit-like protein
MASELEQLRKAAIENNSSYGVTRLREEFRLKPKPGAEPSAWVKSPYNRNKNPVYLVADCVPVREVKTSATPTQRQSFARKITSLKARLRTPLYKTGKALSEWLSSVGDRLCVLDTETTGLGDTDQVIEMAIVSLAGDVVYHRQFKPTVDISDGAFEVHGISMDALSHASHWCDEEPHIKRLLDGRHLVIFNEQFDIRLIGQTSKAFGSDIAWLSTLNVACAMQWSVRAFGSTNRYGTISLSDAVYAANVPWDGRAHSAVTDSQMTRKLILAIAQTYTDTYAQLQQLELEKAALFPLCTEN